MSLDVHLKLKGDCVYDSNITHNLGKMAVACGVYYACWHPEEIGIKRAKWLIPMLQNGVKLLKEHPEFYKQFDSPNGWGMYIHFLPWLEKYLDACKLYPEAKVRTST